MEGRVGIDECYMMIDDLSEILTNDNAISWELIDEVHERSRMAEGWQLMVWLSDQTI